MAGTSVQVATLLVALGLLAGVGITALGPGGVLATVGLFALTPLTPATVAGTAIVTHVATGLLASFAYLRSGQLREPRTRRVSIILAAAAVVGAPLGVVVNSAVSGRVFGILLGAFVAVVGALVWYRERGSGNAHARPRHATPLLAAIGFGVAALSGMFGVGGPMLSVPLLVAIGEPVLSALGAAQVQSIVIAAVGTLGYLIQGAIDWPLAALVGVPELCGVLVGWKVARSTPTRGLRYALIVALFALAPYLALRG